MRRPSASEQRELALTRKADPQPVSAEVVQAQKDFLAALNLQINVSGLDDKEIYIPLDIDAAHWSRIRKGEAHFPLNKLNDLCDLCQNEITLEWFSWRRGKGLVVLESESQRLLRVEREAHDKTRERLQYLEGLHVGRQR